MLLEFSMFPLDKGEHLSAAVSKSIDLIDKSGLPYRFGAMSTSLEGEWDDVFNVVRRCFDKMAEESSRITAVIKLDWKRGRTNELNYKVEAVEKILNRKLSKIE